MTHIGFSIRLKKYHEDTGLTSYAVSKATGVAINSIVKYTETDLVVVTFLTPAVIILADFYGVDWRDPAVIRTVDSVGILA